ncbi:MAG: YHS domain-containing protein [Chloroflexota bacterium]
MSARQDGVTYYFCAKGCRDEFLADPTQFSQGVAELQARGR